MDGGRERYKGALSISKYTILYFYWRGLQKWEGSKIHKKDPGVYDGGFMICLCFVSVNFLCLGGDGSLSNVFGNETPHVGGREFDLDTWLFRNRVAGKGD